MSGSCTCCAGVHEGNGQPIANRPGLPALSYRAGTHSSFLEAMKARLSSARYTALGGLKTRQGDDPAIALLDAWAMVADVLTFYQERIANEGYLRTATERRSILELARLVGYELRPGVAATTYLAYALDEDRSVTPPKPSLVTIPAGSRAQSIPEPGQLPQSFETAEPLVARSSWNALKPRPTRPQTFASVLENGLYLKGVATGLKVHDPLIIDFAGRHTVPFRVAGVFPDPPNERTHVTLRAWKTLADLRAAVRAAMAMFERLAVDDTIPAQAANVSEDLFKLLDRFVKDATKAGTDRTGLATAIKGAFSKLDSASLQKRARAFRVVASPFDEVYSVFAAVSTGLQLTDGAFVEGVDPAQVRRATRDGDTAADVLPALLLAQTAPPAHSTKLARDLGATFSPAGDAVPRMLQALQPSLATTLYAALKNLDVTPPPEIRVYRLSPAAVFGHNAQPKPLRFLRGVITEQGEWPILEQRDEIELIAHEEESVINLDQPYETIVPGSWLVIETAATHLTDAALQVVTVNAVTSGTGRAKYGISGKTTRITLGAAQAPPEPTETSLTGSQAAIWIHIAGREHDDSEFEAIRRTKVHFQGEQLEIVEAPIPQPIGRCAPNPAEIELSSVYDGLESGRWLIVSGERVIAGTSGVKGAELVMLAGVEQRRTATDKTHTYLTLANPLTYCYKRDTVAIYGNVVKATQGETRPKEVLGGGDATRALQQFTLKQPPLTFVPAANPRGVSSTLVVRVNDVKWHERASLVDAGPTDRVYMTQTDDESRTTVIFGDGERGARLPTGQENVVATYRNGIGKAGNVKADQITLLSSRPPGVKEVTNPLRASGGADRESRDQARANAPLAVMALDRLVSTQDYADFARTFAGIGKANAERLTTGNELALQVTIAGVDDIPIDRTSDLYRNLVKALREFGDPLLPLQVEVRELLALVLSARVRVLPDYDWEFVAPAIRARLVDTFGFDRRDLGQPVFLSEVITAIQRVAGVAWVDVDVLHAITEPELSAPAALAQKLADLAAAGSPPSYVNAARGQLAIVVADAPDTIILNEVTREP